MNNVNTLLQAVQQNSFSLGLTWNLHPATVADGGAGLISVIMDGDDSNTRIQAISLIGYLGANVRVMLLVTPPSSIYIVGLVQTDYPPPGTAIVTLRQDSTVQSIADAGSGSFITWDTADYMPFGGWTSGTDFTLPFDGQYLCIGRVVFSSNATSRRGGFVNKNGTTGSPGTIAGESVQAPATGTCQVGGSGVMALTTSDFVGLRAIQNSGAPLNTAPATDTGSSLHVVWLGPNIA
jgi:hypothetical protein